MDKDEALDLALEALENLFGIPDKWTGEGGGDVAVWRLGGSHRAQQAIKAIKQARSAPEQKRPQNCGTGFCSCIECVMEPAPVQDPVAVVKVLPLGDGHKPMHWADWTDADNPPPEGTLLYSAAQPAPVQGDVPEIIDRLEVFVGGLGKAILRELRVALAAQSAVPLTDEQMAKLWVSATIELPSLENCYRRGLKDAEEFHGITKGG